ncbi:MAG: molybdate ABC transporter substrate-binding protein [Acidiferrobacterales bacterium]
MAHNKKRRCFIALAFGLLGGMQIPLRAGASVLDKPAATANEVNVAVAANFIHTVEDLGTEFAGRGGGRLVISSGSTGKLYAQIHAGAPYDILLSADAATPGRLVEQGLAVAGSRFTYARGRLVLWSRSPTLVDRDGKVLRGKKFRHLAIANPKTAPYGAAALAALRHLGLWQSVRSRIVRGEDIGQTFQFADSGNAELAFVALAQLKDPDLRSGGSYWLVPQNLYPPINQQAVLLERAKSNSAALAFLSFLQSPAAQSIIRRYGYGVDLARRDLPPVTDTQRSAALHR